MAKKLLIQQTTFLHQFALLEEAQLYQSFLRQMEEERKRNAIQSENAKDLRHVNMYKHVYHHVSLLLSSRRNLTLFIAFRLLYERYERIFQHSRTAGCPSQLLVVLVVPTRTLVVPRVVCWSVRSKCLTKTWTMQFDCKIFRARDR